MSILVGMATLESRCSCCDLVVDLVRLCDCQSSFRMLCHQHYVASCVLLGNASSSDGDAELRGGFRSGRLRFKGSDVCSRCWLPIGNGSCRMN